MDTISQRIKEIRKANGLTTEQFAQRIMCDKKTIQRYENEHSIPDTYNLKRISMEFGVSTDYILGLSDKMEASYQAEDVTLLYQRYKKMMLNPIQKEKDYFWIKMEMKEDKSYLTSVQSEWVGFIGEGTNEMKEIRSARKVIPEKVIQICEQLRRRPVIINEASEIGVFFLFGGEAIIAEELYEEHVKRILEPIIVDLPKY